MYSPHYDPNSPPYEPHYTTSYGPPSINGLAAQPFDEQREKKRETEKTKKTSAENKTQRVQSQTDDSIGTNLFMMEEHSVDFVSQFKALTSLMHRKWHGCAGSMTELIRVAKRALEAEKIKAAREIDGIVDTIIK